MHVPKVVLLFPSCATKTFGNNGGEGTSNEKTIAPPLGILYLAAELISADMEVEAFDFNAEQYSKHKLREYLVGASVAGISIMSFNLEEAHSLIEDIRNEFPHLPIIAGGPDLILRPRRIEGTVATVCHEAETIIVPLVQAILQKQNLGSIPGICFRDADGETVWGPEFTPQMNLDKVKFPRRELLRVNKGYSVVGKKRSAKITSLITSRGCPKQCSFCAHGAVSYRCFRQRSTENVLEEIRQIVTEGYEVIGIVDDNFTADKKRAMKILAGIKAMNAKLSLAVQGRVDAADPELFRSMREAGVKMITFGLESGNQDVLDFYRKDTTVAMNAAAIAMADRAGLYTGGIFIFGAPFETKEHFKKTYTFATSLPLDITTFWILDYAYGSSLWEEGVKNGTHKRDEFLIPAGKERGTQLYPTEELTDICERYFFHYYLRPHYWFRQAMKFVRIHDFYLLLVILAGLRFLIVRKCTLLMEHIASGLKGMFHFKRRMDGQIQSVSSSDGATKLLTDGRITSV